MGATFPSTSSSPSPVSSSALPIGDHDKASFGNGKNGRPPGLLDNAMKRKGSFIQLFVMTNILFLSLRSLGQKYRINELADENSNLREERESLAVRMASIKSSLLRQAAMDSSGLLSSHLHGLFQNSSSSGH
ncbi:uncharacterized protein LOC110105199 [Dendrobium catenatum]|uniref:Uncharacterized protein n=1 Tax=Dendrobium catenatum TaxID=906689 RepID=A0A2I0WEI4_9ASPA|nr:uncharacterized protein LOC110105199 [Dendrobium catenatum]PKU74067.1 hypothetical protein MA16_Dca011777 [Dendrobium catenatum]